MKHDSFARGRIQFSAEFIKFRPISPCNIARFISSILAVFAIAAGSVTAHSQSTQPVLAAPSLANPPCTLHIWPSATPHTTYEGWFHGGEVDGNRRGIKGYPNMYAEALSTQQQASALAQIDWHALSGDPDLVVVVHQSPSGTGEDRSRTSRLIADAGPCYRELIITSLVVEAGAMTSQSVRILAIRKKFDGAEGLPANFSSMVMAAVQPPEKPGADFDERMRTAVQDAYRAAIGKFMKIQSLH